MNQKTAPAGVQGFIHIFIIIGISILIGVVGYGIGIWQAGPGEIPWGRTCQNLCGDGICQEAVCEGVDCPCAETLETCQRDCPKIIACPQDAMQCPDGSYVGRTGKNCEFECPAKNLPPVTECTKDSDCPSSKYTCEAIQGTGTVCSSDDHFCVPDYTIVEGECKLKEGNRCRMDSDCIAGTLCHKNSCTSPIGRECSGPSDSSCPTDFECVQGCGPSVMRENEPPPSYFCQLKGYQRPCPVCLGKNTLIDTPTGAIPVEEMRQGTAIWTMNNLGERVSTIVVDIAKTPVPSTHKVVHLILEDGREVFVSPGHPVGDGRTVGELAVGDVISGGRVVSAEKVWYRLGFTYDILPSGETGLYWANGILLESTLH